MATYVLVHGAWHGAWCWRRVKDRLQSAGHVVVAPDLRGLGEDMTPADQVTLAIWADQVADLVRRCGEKVILVGHSRGGLVASEVGERCPQNIDCLVYLTAFLLPNGATLMEAAASDPDSLVGPNLSVDAGHTCAVISDDRVADIFYGNCSDEDLAFARRCLRPEPLAPLATPVTVTADRFGSVRRVYVECLQDKAITIQAQRAMQQALPCHAVYVLDADHSPFFSAHEQLCEILLNL
jgi:pimeloyl-ACP methyl ester carboxylesterase